MAQKWYVGQNGDILHSIIINNIAHVNMMLLCTKL